ncbi:MAG: cytochrome c [SAR324 cluster bacterium]|nr:cytochrome c [SAR324 cluster bacterium]
MYHSIPKALKSIFAGILIVLLTGCSGPLNINQNEQKYLSNLDVESVQRGKDLYQNNCQFCHGEKGQGDGPKAEKLDKKPANLTERGVHITQYGMRAVVDFPHYSPDSVKLRVKYGNDTMPGYKEKLTDQDLQDITNYIIVLMHDS